MARMAVVVGRRLWLSSSTTAVYDLPSVFSLNFCRCCSGAGPRKGKSRHVLTSPVAWDPVTVRGGYPGGPSFLGHWSGFDHRSDNIAF